MANFQKLINRLENNIQIYAGYPPNTQFDYSELYQLLKYPINNLGDPFELKNPFSTQEYEQEVIKWFLRLYSNNGAGWGYVTTGSTEGVLFGMWNGREKLNNPVVYFSEYAHYCVPKHTAILKLEYKIIKSNEQGEMDINDFEKKLVMNRDALIVATLGSTITSSVDDIRKIISILENKGINHYIHADAAIDGMILPFIHTKAAYKFDDGIGSISISGHKIIGSPIPCGVVLIQKNHVFGNNTIEILQIRDATITGSRNGFTALILWYAIKKLGKKGFSEFVNGCLNNADLYCHTLNENNIKAWRLDQGLSIVLDKLPTAITNKWRIPSNHKYSSLFALPKLTINMINEIIQDIHYFNEHSKLFKEEPRILFPESSDEIALKD